MRQLTYDWCKYGFAPVIKASAKACYTQTTGYIGHKWHLTPTLHAAPGYFMAKIASIPSLLAVSGCFGQFMVLCTHTAGCIRSFKRLYTQTTGYFWI